MFRSIDADGSGSVDIDELRSFIWGEERPWAVEPESAASRAELTRCPGAKVCVLSVGRTMCREGMTQ